MMNCLGILGRPGEFAVDHRLQPDGTRKLYVWPLEEKAGPLGIDRSVRPYAFDVRASHVIIQGFRIQKQGGTERAVGITGGGKGTAGIVVRDNEISLVRAARHQVLALDDTAKCSIVGNYVHENRRAGGISLNRCSDGVVVSNRLHKNGATGLLLYGCRGVTVSHNAVTDHKGMHANGLTAYLGCSGITFVGNRVRGGNVALTLQEGEDMLVCNNVFDGDDANMCVGLWNVGTLKNVRFLNNLFVRGARKSDWALGVYCGGSGEMAGYVFRNNVVDGMYREGPIAAEHSHNVYTRPVVSGKQEWKLGAGEALQAELKKLFVDPDNGDWRPRPGGPLISAGTSVGLKEDIAGTKLPQGQAPDVGAYQHLDAPAKTSTKEAKD